MDHESLYTIYTRRFESVLQPMAFRLEQYLRDLLKDTPRLDSIRARAKSPNRFLQKAEKLQDGVHKYLDPLNQIQDQLGARIVVFYVGDIVPICDTLKRYFRLIEEKAFVPDSPKEFDYEGRHFIMFIPSDIFGKELPQDKHPTFFELQVKTLFQHSWAEANHDLAYKTASDLTLHQRRKIAFTAAQAWGADNIFQDLACELRVFEREI